MRYQSLLLIDDDPEDGELFMMALKKVSQSVRCDLVFSAEEALHRLEGGDLKPDLILLDLNMPIMNGFQFLEEKRQRMVLDGIPVYVFSTTSQKTQLDRARALGALETLTKPDSLPELVAMVQTMLS